MAGTDCGCSTHDGLHWRHMDRLWWQQNREYLAALTHPSRTAEQRRLAYDAWVEQEYQRLEWKENELRREGQTFATDGAGD